MHNNQIRLLSCVNVDNARVSTVLSMYIVHNVNRDLIYDVSVGKVAYIV